MHSNKLDEFGMIKHLAGLLPKAPKDVVGIGDDTAVLPYSKSEHLLFTTDMMAVGVHFTKKMDPQAIGHKALACNISDIAAMGGKPSYAVVSLGVPKNTDQRFIENIYKGIAKTAKEFGVSVVGGDTISSNKIVINIALLGLADKKNVTLRSGAKAKDWIFISGPLGNSFKSGKHLTFTPQVEKAQFLVKNFKPSAMIDISDGLTGDLNHILEASAVGARLWPEAVPLNKGATYTNALSDGEDYELLFTLNQKQALKLMHWQFTKKVFFFYPIGEITANKKQQIHGKSYTHF